MTLSEIIPSILSGVMGGAVWRDATPDQLPRDPVSGVILPFVIWSIMGGTDSLYIEQFPAPEVSNVRLQLITFSPTAIGVDTLHRDVRDALLASTYTVGVYGSPVGTYDAARKLYGNRQQFSIWFRQSQS